MPYRIMIFGKIGSGNGSLPNRHQAITWIDTDVFQIRRPKPNISKTVLAARTTALNKRQVSSK